MLKRCKRCNKLKSKDNFYKYKKATDGLNYYCKDCIKERVYENRKIRPEHYRNYQKEHVNKNKEKYRDAVKRYYKQNKYKVICWVEFRKGVRRGLITRKPCEICGKEKVEAHHDDYNKPLEVRWLCVKHHNKVHKLINKSQ